MPVASFDAMVFLSSSLKLRHSSGLSAAGFDSSACAAVLCTAQIRAQYASCASSSPQCSRQQKHGGDIEEGCSIENTRQLKHLCDML